MVKFFVPSPPMRSSVDTVEHDDHYRFWVGDEGLPVPEEFSQRVYSIDFHRDLEDLTATVGQFISGTPDLVLAIAWGGPAGMIIFTDGGKTLRRPPVWNTRAMVGRDEVRRVVYFD